MYIFMCTFLVQMTVFLIKEQVVTPQSDSGFTCLFVFSLKHNGEKSVLNKHTLHLSQMSEAQYFAKSQRHRHTQFL